jgi:hypothetical protein
METRDARPLWASPRRRLPWCRRLCREGKGPGTGCRGRAACARCRSMLGFLVGDSRAPPRDLMTRSLRGRSDRSSVLGCGPRVPGQSRTPPGPGAPRLGTRCSRRAGVTPGRGAGMAKDGTRPSPAYVRLVGPAAFSWQLFLPAADDSRTELAAS